LPLLGLVQRYGAYAETQARHAQPASRLVVVAGSKRARAMRLGSLLTWPPRLRPVAAWRTEEHTSS